MRLAKRRGQRGFTLIELLIVVAIIGISRGDPESEPARRAAEGPSEVPLSATSATSGTAGCRGSLDQIVGGSGRPDRPDLHLDRVRHGHRSHRHEELARGFQPHLELLRHPELPVCDGCGCDLEYRGAFGGHDPDHLQRAACRCPSQWRSASLARRSVESAPADYSRRASSSVPTSTRTSCGRTVTSMRPRWYERVDQRRLSDLMRSNWTRTGRPRPP